MDKIFKMLACALLLLAVSACNRGYKIIGEIPIEGCDGEKVYLVDITSMKPMDSTVIADGKFQFAGKVEGCQMAEIVAVVGSDKYGSNVVLENGTIHINIVTDTLYGTPMNDLYCSSFNAPDTTAKRLKKEMLMYMERYYSATTPEEQREAVEEWRQLQETFNSHQAKVSRSVYEKNKDNIIGAYALSRVVEIENWNYSTLDSVMSQSAHAVTDFAPLQKALQWLFHVDNTSEGKMFVDIDGIDFATGNPTKLSAMLGEGEVTIVDFWASWCGPCRREITDNLVPLYAKYHDKGLNIIGVDVWDKLPDHQKAVTDLGITYPQLIDTTRTATENYGVDGIPTILLLGQDGTILNRGIRGEEIEAAIVEALKK